MIIKTKYSILALLIFFSLVGCSQERPDLSVPMKAGEYQVAVTKVTNGRKDPIDRTKVRCYRESAFDPYRDYYKNENCKLSDVVKGENQVSFNIDCDKGALADTKGKIEYRVDGENLRWSINISSIGGKEISVLNSGAGKYLGKCK